MAAIEIANLSKTFKCCALDDVSLTIRPGEMVALIGSSGSGKSTLLRHIAGLTAADKGPKGGEIRVGGRIVQKGGRIARDIRESRAAIGVVFQQFNLVGRLSVLTNVLVGHLGRIPNWRGALGMFSRHEKVAALQALSRVGIADKAVQRASTLSGGQQQRAAIARTLVQRAELVLADEPIASLDPEASRRVMETLATINREDGTTVVVSLHQVDYAIRYCVRTVALRHGKVVYDGPSEALTPAFLKQIYGAECDELFAEARIRPQAVKPVGRLVPAFAV